MNWQQALAKAKRVNCYEALPVCLEIKPGAKPTVQMGLDDDPATVVCKIKVRAGLKDDQCDKNCPLKGY